MVGKTGAAQTICDQFSDSEKAEIGETNWSFCCTERILHKAEMVLEEDRTVQKAFAQEQLLFGTIDTWLTLETNWMKDSCN